MEYTRAAREAFRALAWERRYTQQKRLRKLDQEVRRYPWTYFVTQTFHPRFGCRDPQVTLDWYTRILPLLPDWGLIRAFVVTDHHKTGWTHLHMLWEHSPSTSSDWRTIKEYLYSTCGIARVHPYDPRKGALGYTMRYMMKGGRRAKWSMVVLPERNKPL